MRKPCADLVKVRGEATVFTATITFTPHLSLGIKSLDALDHTFPSSSSIRQWTDFVLSTVSIGQKSTVTLSCLRWRTRKTQIECPDGWVTFDFVAPTLFARYLKPFLP